ncbi:MAG: outer membrane lipoprotein-sorting protein [Proteobacteria bacterium]|nr:outer membrane lipoprotein-sorting protein [Pseudomonadota bacterium]
MAGSAVAADAPKAAGAATAKAKAPAAAAEWPARVPRLSAEQIIEKHIAARGGAAWNSVQTLQFTGKLEAGKADSLQRTTAMFQQDKRFRGKAEPKTAAADGKDAGKQVELPFTLDFKRPHKTRMEITFAGKTAWQVYDGEHGWKFRPFLNRTDVEPFTAEETETEAHQDNLGGPLFDYAARGVKVSVERADTVDGNDAYKLKLVPKEGPSRYIWIDAKSFLDVKVEGTPRRMDGRKHDVFVIQRDFRKVQGVMLPFLLETAVDGYPDTHKMRIENATVNPTLDDKLFTKPAA